jgi:hypothetical protein
MSPPASTPDVLDLLVEQYEAVPAPAPSAELRARMDAGHVGAVVTVAADDDDRDRAGAVVIPLAPRRHVRLRYLVAATLAMVVAMSGMAVAGVLPDGLQRQAASVASEFGINLPNPDAGPTPAGNNGTNGSGGSHGDTGPSSGGGGSGGGTNPSGSKSGGTGVGAGTTTTTSPGGNAGLPPLSLPSTTIPSTGTLPGLPPVSTPPVSVPSITLPSVTLPPLHLPPFGL